MHINHSFGDTFHQFAYLIFKILRVNPSVHKNLLSLNSFTWLLLQHFCDQILHSWMHVCWEAQLKF
jgi:hypothetical protein